MRKTIAAPIAAIVAPIAANKGFAAINDLTASAAFLKPFATPLRTLVVPFPVFATVVFIAAAVFSFFERLSTASATPLVAVCTVFSSSAV